MSAGQIWLGASGSEVLLSAYGRKFTVRDTEITRELRTSSGKLVKEIIATKKIFNLDYSTITGTALNALLTIYALQAELSLIVYYTEIATSYTVLMGPLDRTRLILLDDGLWTGVSVELKEV